MDFLRRLNSQLQSTCWADSLLLTSSGCTAGLGFLSAVFRAALVPSVDARGVERSANDVITHAGEILYAATPNQHNRVFLQIVAFTGNVGGDLEPIREPHARHLAKS